MMNELINYGIASINKPKKTKDRKTIVVFGVARSGTSMVASVLDKLGVFLGQYLDDVVLEDVELAGILENKKDEEELKRFIEKRNTEHKLWGWKRPGSIQYVDQFAPLLTNPYFIIVFRDSLAIALRNRISVHTDLINNLKHTHNQYISVIEFVKKTKYPCLLISYEKAISKKHIFVQQLAEYLDLNLSEKMLNDTIQTIQLDKKDYLLSARVGKVRGVLDRIAGTIIRGWAFQDKNEDSQKVDIYMNNVKIATVIADLYREDLEKGGIGNGKHAFEFDLKEHIKNQTNYTIQAFIHNSDIELKNSPLIVK